MFVVFIVLMNVSTPDCMAFSVVCFDLFDLYLYIIEFSRAVVLRASGFW